MREKVLQFGLRKSLVGILTVPAETIARRGVVFLNSGILHSVGASRLHVTTARDLAEMGVPSIRFDQSTIGDSGPRYASGSYLTAAAAETGQAIDILKRKTGVESVVLYGLCSGSDVGFMVAAERDDVCGLVQLDPYVYRTWRYYVNHYRPRIANASTWMHFIRRLPATLFHRCPNIGNSAAQQNSWFERPEYIRTFPPRSEVSDIYKKLLQRGVRILCVFSGGQVYMYNYEGQLREALSDCSFGDLLTEKFYPCSTHIFTHVPDQIALRECVVDWIQNSFADDLVAQADQQSNEAARQNAL